MPSFLLVALGGAVGAMARFFVSSASVRLFGAGFPYGTLAVNIVGGLAMGALAAATKDRTLFLLLGAGVLGGFTTFSAFSLEMWRMLEEGRFVLALTYACASVALSIGALALGYSLTRSISA